MALLGVALLILICQIQIGLASAKISCTFDFGLCDWSVDEDSNFHWRNTTGPTDDRTSGPLSDHTCQNIKGSYLYISGYDVEDFTSTAQLSSNNSSLAKNSSLTFWYHMNGAGIGSLILNRIDLGVSGGESKNKLWDKTGRQRGGWSKATVALSSGTFRLEFQATASRPISADIAIDDVLLLSEQQDVAETDRAHCKLPPTTTPITTMTPVPTTTRRRTKRPTTQIALTTTKEPVREMCGSSPEQMTRLPGSCNFDNSLCGYTVISGVGDKGITWNRTDQVDRYKNAIKGGHSGKYMRFTDSYYLWDKTLRNASLISPPINNTFACLSFWYASPAIKSNLVVTLRLEDGDELMIWNSTGMVVGWREVILPINADQPFSVVFRTENIQYPARVGVDDIMIMSNESSEVTKLSTAPPIQTGKPSVSPSTGTRTVPHIKPEATSPESTKRTPNAPASSRSTHSVTKAITSRVTEVTQQPIVKSSFFSSSITAAPTESPKATKKTSTSQPNHTTQKKDNTKPDNKKGAESYDDPEKQSASRSKDKSLLAGAVVGALCAGILIGVVGHFLYSQQRNLHATRMGHSNKRPDRKVGVQTKEIGNGHVPMSIGQGRVNNGYVNKDNHVDTSFEHL